MVAKKITAVGIVNTVNCWLTIPAASAAASARGDLGMRARGSSRPRRTPARTTPPAAATPRLLAPPAHPGRCCAAIRARNRDTRAPGPSIRSAGRWRVNISGPMPRQRPRHAHAQAVAPQQRTRAAPGIFRKPARAAAQRLSGRRDVECRQRRASRAARRAARRTSAAPRTVRRARSSHTTAPAAEPEQRRARAREQHRNHAPAPRITFASTARQREAQEHHEQQPRREVAHIAQGRRRPHDRPDAFADVIRRGRQNRVPAEILRDAIQRGDAAGHADHAQHDARCAAPAWRCPRQKHDWRPAPARRIAASEYRRTRAPGSG